MNLFREDGVLANGATSATIRLTTGDETYYPAGAFFTTDIFAPEIRPVKSVVDVNGGATERGDELEYTVRLTNAGQDPAVSLRFFDPIPARSALRAEQPRGHARDDARGRLRRVRRAIGCDQRRPGRVRPRRGPDRLPPRNRRERHAGRAARARADRVRALPGPSRGRRTADQRDRQPGRRGLRRPDARDAVPRGAVERRDERRRRRRPRADQDACGWRVRRRPGLRLHDRRRQRRRPPHDGHRDRPGRLRPGPVLRGQLRRRPRVDVLDRRAHRHLHAPGPARSPDSRTRRSSSTRPSPTPCRRP